MCVCVLKRRRQTVPQSLSLSHADWEQNTVRCPVCQPLVPFFSLSLVFLCLFLFPAIATTAETKTKHNDTTRHDRKKENKRGTTRHDKTEIDKNTARKKKELEGSSNFSYPLDGVILSLCHPMGGSGIFFFWRRIHPRNAARPPLMLSGLLCRILVVVVVVVLWNKSLWHLLRNLLSNGVNLLDRIGLSLSLPVHSTIQYNTCNKMHHGPSFSSMLDSSVCGSCHLGPNSSPSQPSCRRCLRPLASVGPS